MRLAHDALEAAGWEKEEIVLRIAYHLSTDTLKGLLRRIVRLNPEALPEGWDVGSIA
jgi:hypothetical protein